MVLRGLEDNEFWKKCQEFASEKTEQSITSSGMNKKIVFHMMYLIACRIIERKMANFIVSYDYWSLAETF